MPRRLVVLIVAVLLPCHGFAALGKSIALASDHSGHALAHWAEQAHHHHDDGTSHDDDSSEASLHLQVMDASSTPVLMPAPSLIPAPFCSCRPAGDERPAGHRTALPPRPAKTAALRPRSPLIAWTAMLLAAIVMGDRSTGLAMMGGVG